MKNNKRNTFGGFSDDGEFFKMNHEEFKNNAIGLIIMAIGERRFKEEMEMVINTAFARGMKREYDLTKEENKIK